jgi:hypothetical protein
MLVAFGGKGSELCNQVLASFLKKIVILEWL